MVDAERTRVCSVVNTDLADCQLVAMLFCRLCDADRVHLCEPVPNPTGELHAYSELENPPVRSALRTRELLVAAPPSEDSRAILITFLCIIARRNQLPRSLAPAYHQA
jgi:hypothetical protein